MHTRPKGTDIVLRRRVRAARLGLPAALVLTALFVLVVVLQAAAADPANPYFERTWQRTDGPVKSGQVSRTWLWGDGAHTGALSEPYAESPGGERTVQYYDKSRMEITAPDADSGSPWYVTNGLLVVELITGRLQLSDDVFEQRDPADVNVAGDFDGQSPTYRTMAGLLDAAPHGEGAIINQRLDWAGNVTSDSSLVVYSVTAAYHVVVPGIDHRVASPFWEFMNSTGTVYENGAYVESAMFLNAFYATGFPIAEAYWANVKVDGVYQDVLLQCFERRCLTYTPGNPAGWQVEAGNVGQHYYTWRYGQAPNEEATTTPGPTATATATSEPSATATEPPEQPSATPTTTQEAPASPTPVQESYVYVRQWGGPVDPDTTFDSPYGIATSSDGYVYVTDWRTNRVLKFATNGEFLSMWGGTGGGAGTFATPTGVAIDAAGNVYVADSNNHRVQKFDSNGEFLTQWGSPDGLRGSLEGEFDAPQGIAVDSSGYVYVVDTGNVRIQKFDSDGEFIDAWGSEGAGAGQFSLPHGIAIDDDDIIYVSDYLRCRIQWFDTDGAYLGELDTDTTGGTCSFQFDSGIVVSATGVVYVVDAGKDRIQAFDTDGTVLGEWGTSGSGPGEFNQPIGIAIDASGVIYVTDFDNSRVQTFDDRGNHLDEWNDGRRGWLAGSTLGMTMDAGGNIFLADDVYDRIQGFDAGGDFLQEFGKPGSGAGQLDGAVNLAATTDGFIYAVDSRNDRVLKYRRDGVFVTEFGSGYLNVPVGIAVDKDGNIYVANAGDDTVQKFDASGSFLHVWGESGDGVGQFNYPADIAIYDNQVYVVDHNNHRVQLFDRNGVYLGQWGGLGDGDGQFAEPMGIGVDGDGSVYVVDTGNHRVQVFKPNGEFLTQFGSEGSGDGQFSFPSRVEISASGDVYILDTGNYRVQIFKEESQASAV